MADRAITVAAWESLFRAQVTIMRALVKLTLGHTLATTLASDIADACKTLEKKGGLHEIDRQRVKTGTGY